MQTREMIQMTIVALCCIGLTFAVPIKDLKQQTDSEKQAHFTEQNLPKALADTIQSLNNLDLQSHKTYHVTNVNGKVETEEEKEEKVVNPESGKVVLDIKEKTNGDSQHPAETETDIDVPSAGIHKQILSQAEPRNQEAETEEDVENSPKAVATYLMVTGEFQKFDQALRELVNASEMTSEEAAGFRDQVRTEYNKLVRELEVEKVMSESQFLPYAIDNTEIFTDPFEAPASVNDLYQLYGSSGIPSLDIQELQDQSSMRSAVGAIPTFNALIQELMDEWLGRAIENGDNQARNMLKNIYDVVSKDDNPDNMRQVEQALTDIFANAVVSSLLPRDQPSYQLPVFNDIPAVLQTAESNEANLGKAEDQLSSQQQENKSSVNIDKEETALEELQDSLKGNTAPMKKH